MSFLFAVLNEVKRPTGTQHSLIVMRDQEEFMEYQTQHQFFFVEQVLRTRVQKVVNAVIIFSDFVGIQSSWGLIQKVESRPTETVVCSTDFPLDHPLLIFPPIKSANARIWAANPVVNKWEIFKCYSKKNFGSAILTQVFGSNRSSTQFSPIVLVNKRVLEWNCVAANRVFNEILVV